MSIDVRPVITHKLSSEKWLMSKTQRLKSFCENYIVKIGFGAVVIIQLLVMGLISFGFVEVSKPIAANDTLLGSILATISAYLLYSQLQIQKRQTNIEEKILDYETKPVLEVVEKNFEGNSVEVSMANYGYGVGVDLHLNCRVEAPEIEWFEGTDSSTPLKRKDEENVLEDTSIRPQKDPDTYRANNITIGRKIGNYRVDNSTFETTMGDLLEEDDVTIHVELWVSGSPKVGNHTIEERVCEKFTIDSSIRAPRPDLQNSYQFQK